MTGLPDPSDSPVKQEERTAVRIYSQAVAYTGGPDLFLKE